MKTQDRIHTKVRLLLAKAESTEYTEEAAAYTAKAQELIALHAIDMALVEEREGKGQIVTRLVEVPSPYPKEKYILLGGIARANNCRAILGVERDTLKRMMDDNSFFAHKSRLASVVGYESDLDAVEMLFTSLLVQAVNEMLSHGTQINEWGENRTKSFRRSFLSQFAWTVRERLAEATDSVRKDAVESHGESLLPVLVGREEAVEAEVNERFPHTTTLRHSVSNYHGVIAGDAAGRRANLGTKNLPGRQSALPR